MGQGVAQRFVGIPTTPKKSTGKTPFSLTYAAKAIIPTEVNLCSARVVELTLAQNDGLMIKCLDLLEEY